MPWVHSKHTSIEVAPERSTSMAQLGQDND